MNICEIESIVDFSISEFGTDYVVRTRSKTRKGGEIREQMNEWTEIQKIEGGVPFLVRARVRAYSRLFPEEIKLDSERGLGNALALSFAFLVRDCLITLRYVRSKSFRR